MVRQGAPSRSWGAGFIAGAYLCLAPHGAAAAEPSLTDLSYLSLEQLGDLSVTSVSKHAQPLSGAPAAIFVITRDDIQRTAATSLPEILRLAPNLQVARSSANTYAITARGFNQPTATANKLLVLIDGRVVYSPLFSGVFWDAQNVVIDDIERIEVISGPAGTLWGANAVNGVINIITRHSKDTQGNLADIRAGTVDDSVTLRHGGKFGENTSYRVYAMGLRNGSSLHLDGTHAEDRWENAQAGFRIDWSDAGDAMTVQGDLYEGRIEDVPGQVAQGTIGGQNLLASWTRQLMDGSSLKTQIYYDNTRRNLTSGIRADIDTFDFDGQYEFAIGEQHDVVIGGGYRMTRDKFVRGPGTSFLDPASRTLNLGNIFAQDTIALAPDLSLTAGLKIENNSYTGTEFMPDARLAWRVSDHTVLWASASRAVRTPSRFDRDLINPGILQGGPDFESEDLLAFELGYRGELSENFSLSVSTYYNIYKDLRTVEASNPFVFPLVIANGMRGNTYGVEAWGTWVVSDWWHMNAGVSALREDLSLEPGSADILGIAIAGNDPSYQFQLRSDMDLSDTAQLQLGLRNVDALANPAVPNYVEADARLNWRVMDGFELTLAGTNLLHARHREFASTSLQSLAIPRTLYLGARWEF